MLNFKLFIYFHILISTFQEITLYVDCHREYLYKVTLEKKHKCRRNNEEETISKKEKSQVSEPNDNKMTLNTIRSNVLQACST